MELRAEELRIGNWIKSEPLSIPRLNIQSNGYMQITGYGISVLESDTNGKLPWSPIPLTEEILLKCGFEKRGIFWFDLHLDEKTKLTLGWHPDGRIDFEISINKNYFDISHIKHLHQLQNLYFALTGTELNVKL